MAVDILNYTQVDDIARRIVLPESEKALGVFLGGHDLSMQLGDGFEIDGLHDYQPGADEARHIDWAKSASRSDGGMWVRDHYDDRSPLTVLVSDIPSDRLARAYGEGDPLSTRALGFVASHLLLQANKRDGSPVLAVWSGGIADDGTHVSQIFEDVRTPRKVIEAGLRVAQASSSQSQKYKEAADARVGLFRRRKEIIPLASEPFADVIEKAYYRARRVASAARFIIVSDFRDDPEDIFESMRKLRKNEVISVEVTNPHLRELPTADVIMASGTGKGVYVENDKMREEYKRKAAERQAYITEGIAKHTSHNVSIDTGNFESIRNLSKLGRKNKR